MTNWSTLRPLIPYTTHQEFLTRSLEGPDQRPRGQLDILLQLDIVREDAPKNSNHISRVKRLGWNDIWKMSYLRSGRILSLIYLSRRLSYLWKLVSFLFVSIKYEVDMPGLSLGYCLTDKIPLCVEWKV